MNYSDISDLSSVTGLTLNVSEETSQGAYKQKVYAKQYDKTSRYLEVTVMSGDEEVILPLGAIPRIRCTKPDGTTVFNDGCIHENRVYVELSEELLSVVGTASADIGIYSGESILSTEPFDIEIIPMQYNAARAGSSDEFSALTQALTTVGNIYAVQAEVENIRKGADGRNYASAGDAVREQINGINTLIYKGRDEKMLTPGVMCKCSRSIAEMERIEELPDNSWIIASGAALQPEKQPEWAEKSEEERANYIPKLGVGFEWTLAPGRSYMISRTNWTNSSTSVFSVQSISAVDAYHGYTVSGRDGITWKNVSIDSAFEECLAESREYTDNIVYAGRSADDVTPQIPAKYVGDAELIADAEQLPDDSWAVLAGAKLQPKLGGNFIWKLGETRTYMISRRNWSPSSSSFLIRSISAGENYWGYTVPHKEGITWINLTKTSSSGVGEEILYTEITRTKGWWGANGEFVDTARYHSQLMPITAGKSYYTGYKFIRLNPESTSDITTTGAFFDVNGNWIAPLMTDDVTEYACRYANGVTENAGQYAEIYTFTAPEHACYVSLNLSTGVANTYRQYLSSSPVLALSNTGNYRFGAEYPVYQAHKDKKLCVIGASGVALDRETHNLSTDPNKNNNQHIIGFQEYLVPWYALVESYGFADSGYMRGGNESNGEKSICKNILDGIKIGEETDENGEVQEVREAVDFSAYDEFLLIPSTNDLRYAETESVNGEGETEMIENPDKSKSNMGGIDSTDEYTYFGALNAIIAKIYAESPKAKIYIANAVHKGSYYDSTFTAKKIDLLNSRLSELAKTHSIQLIDLAALSGINRFNYGKGRLTYDNVHLNQEGSKWMGLCLRKEIVGI